MMSMLVSQAQRVVSEIISPRGRSIFTVLSTKISRLYAKDTLSWTGNDQSMKMRGTSREQDKEPVANNNLKTRMLVQRAAYMIEDGVPASSILLFSFTKKAANEIAERIEKTIGDKARGITVSTYHSFCARQLRFYARYVGYETNYTIIDSDDKDRILDKLCKEEDIKIKPVVFASAISKFKERHLTPKQAAARTDDSEAGTMKVISMYEKYQKYLKKNNAMDFDDLLFNMVTILEQNEIVRSRIQKRYKYIVADECQDSSDIDTKFLFLLMDPETHNLCLIGDSDQAIYGFRGANFKGMFDKINKYDHNNFSLGQNYRSTQNIVNGAQSLIRYNTRLDKKTVFSENEVGDKISCVTTSSQADEARRITNIIKNSVKSGEHKYGDFAILYRNQFLSWNLEKSFLSHNIPYTIVNGHPFCERTEVKDILAFLEFIQNPKNLIALSRVIDIPKNRIGAKTLDKITAATSQIYESYAIIGLKDAVEVLSSVAETDKSLTKKMTPFINRMKNIRDYIEDVNPDTYSLIKRIVVEFNYNQYLKDTYKDDFDERIKNVSQMYTIAKEFPDVAEFLESLVLTNENDSNAEEVDKAKQDNRVILMTMHGSKGLEFPIVFIVDAVEDIIPSKFAKTTEAVEEERRLFYVAMTRAKETLVIFSPQSMMRFGQNEYYDTSRFVKEIDPKYCDII